MGKGGTRFVGEAIAHRSGRAKTSYTSKELKKNMEKFLETGVHPDLERAKQSASSGVVVALPDPDSQRPHIFLDLSVDNRSVGRLVVEMFEDVAPAAARHLINRVQQGASASLHNCKFHKLLPYYALYGGKSASASFPGGQGVPLNSRLQHMMRGAVSVSRDGSDFAICLGKCLTMDETHQVVGVVRQGLDLLDLLDDIPRSPDDTPLMAIKVVKCGNTNAPGSHESLDEALAKETPEAAAARLKQQSADTRSAVMEALQQGMSHKRSATEAGLGAGSSAAAAAAAAGAGSSAAAGSSKAAAEPAAQQKEVTGTSQAMPAAAAAGGPSKRSKVLDSLLDELEGGSSGSSSEDGGSSSQEGE
ncbi:hypothetical protein OEZ86_009830 [Tetradesmus obliquus]|uniref:PPIase cyclophilin-type domain-containing protein n=1 Tax=Tetradesmus obliquus TaxID=3088 RepID=A0ABY8UNB6_TETOB|nr:hypothetical protein OEZ85_001268 [Tetradesmus obliquus]WIA43336.1 hypothetical protein OEZ86_009830 [Tetradesmus obliquus]